MKQVSEYKGMLRDGQEDDDRQREDEVRKRMQRCYHTEMHKHSKSSSLDSRYPDRPAALQLHAIQSHLPSLQRRCITFIASHHPRAIHPFYFIWGGSQDLQPMPPDQDRCQRSDAKCHEKKHADDPQIVDATSFE